MNLARSLLSYEPTVWLLVFAWESSLLMASCADEQPMDIIKQNIWAFWQGKEKGAISHFLMHCSFFLLVVALSLYLHILISNQDFVGCL